MEKKRAKSSSSPADLDIVINISCWWYVFFYGYSRFYYTPLPCHSFPAEWVPVIQESGCGCGSRITFHSRYSEQKDWMEVGRRGGEAVRCSSANLPGIVPGNFPAANPITYFGQENMFSSSAFTFPFVTVAEVARMRERREGWIKSRYSRWDSPALAVPP